MIIFKRKHSLPTIILSGGGHVKTSGYVLSTSSPDGRKLDWRRDAIALYGHSHLANTSVETCGQNGGFPNEWLNGLVSKIWMVLSDEQINQE